MSEQDLVPVERKLYGEKKYTVHMQRKNQAKIDKCLTPSMQDARHEIERAFRIIAGQQLGVTDHSLNKVRGEGGSDNGAWQMDQIKKFDDWKKECARLEYAVTLDFVVFDLSAREVAFQRGFGCHKTALSWLRKGLNVYCVLQGWGEQINT